MLSNIVSPTKSMSKRVDYKQKNNMMGYQGDYWGRTGGNSMPYPLKDLSGLMKPTDGKYDTQGRKMVTSKLPTTPKNSNNNNEQKTISMVYSPEEKLVFGNINHEEFIPKNLQNNPNHIDDLLPSASTSTESLLSSNNKPYTNSNINTNNAKKMVKSHDNLYPPQVFVPPFLCYPIPPMPLFPAPKAYYPKRKLPLNNTQFIPINHPNKRIIIPPSTRTDNSRRTNSSFFNKFNSPNEQNENTEILKLQVKVGAHDYRMFKLRKYDDLSKTLQEFFAMNDIREELVQPIINKIFSALNKIFWLFNNKIGLYDQGYLLSLYKLWRKNKGRMLHKKNDLSNSNPWNSSNESGNDNEKAQQGSHSFGYYEEVDEDDYPRLNKSF